MCMRACTLLENGWSVVSGTGGLMWMAGDGRPRGVSSSASVMFNVYA